MKPQPLILAVAAALALPAHAGHAADNAVQQAGAEIRETMSRAILLARAGRKKEALDMMHAQFPKGPPDELALEYYRIVGEIPEGWEEAKNGLEKRVKAAPEDLRYRLALAAHLTLRDTTRREGIRALAALAKRQDVDKQQAMEAWRRALAMLGDSVADMRLYREYLAVDPENQEVRGRFADAQRAEAERQRIAHDPGMIARRQGLALLDEGKLEEANRILAQALALRPKDPEIIGGIGMVRLREGRHDDAKGYFEQALRLDADNAGKWRSLVSTATFWGLLRESSAARDEHKLDLAEEKVRAALRIDPANAEAIALLAGIYADRNEFAEAESLYRQVLGREADNGSAIRGLVGLMLRQGRRKEAVALLDSQGDEHSMAAAKFTYLRVSILRDEADRLLVAGQLEQAVQALRQALSLEPANPWVRFDLAKLYRERDDLRQARTTMQHGLKVAPDDPQMLFANALFLTSLDEPEQALALLEQVPPPARTPSILNLKKRASIQLLIQRAGALDVAGYHTVASTLLERAESLAGDDPALIDGVANAWIKHGDPARAIGSMRSLLARQATPSAGLNLRYAALLNRLERDAELSSLLEQLAPARGLSAEETLELRRLQSALAIRHAEALRKAGNYAAAREALAPVLKREPANTDARLALARVESAAGNIPAARREIETILAASPEDDLDTRLRVAEQLIDMPDLAWARRIADRLMMATAGNARVLVLYGRIARAAGQYDEAMDYFRQARRAESRLAENAPESPGQAKPELRLDETLHPALAGKRTENPQNPEPGIKLNLAESTTALAATPATAATQAAPTEAEEAIESMERRRQPRVASGYSFSHKPGTAGVSDISVSEIPVAAHIPLGYRGHMLVNVDAVDVGAGKFALDDLYTLRRFGKIQAFAPNGVAGISEQNAKGMAVALGYETDDTRVDIGTTPLGFPVQDIVGGFKRYFSADPYSYSIDLARRPVTGSLVSYAGTRDPVSGEVWGGVRSNGVNLRASYGRGRYDVSTSLGYHLLTGRNVLTNMQFESRTEASWAIISNDDMHLSTGLVFTYWHYRDDLGYYTFGHGGYYSPQRYQSFTIPWRWSGRSGKLSYMLKGSVSASQSYEKDMPFYPTDAALQTLAGNPVLAGGSGVGSGFSLGGALEYRLTPRLFIGGRLEIARSDYYTPDFATLYLRYVFDPKTSALPDSPDPVEPYSQF